MSEFFTSWAILRASGEVRRRLGQHVQLSLVVGDAAAVDPLAALLEREGIGLPELERIGRLDVHVPVDKYRRDLTRGLTPGPVRSGQVAEDQRVRLGLDDLGRAAGRAHERGQPLRRVVDVPGAGGVGADAGDAQQLGELVEPGLSHGAAV